MGLFSTLGNLIQLVKNACFNVVTVLTALVALGNELKRLKVSFSWLDERREELQKAWYASLVVFVVLSVAYALIEHRADVLVVDLLSVGLMGGVVYYLAHRGKGDGEEDDDEAEELSPRRPLQGPRRHRRVPRRRRQREQD